MVSRYLNEILSQSYLLRNHTGKNVPSSLSISMQDSSSSILILALPTNSANDNIQGSVDSLILRTTIVIPEKASTLKKISYLFIKTVVPFFFFLKLYKPDFQETMEGSFLLSRRQEIPSCFDC